MSKARVVIAAVEIEHRPVSEVAREYQAARSWITLLGRYRAGGEAGLEPRSRRPRSNPRQTPAEVEDRVVQLRKRLHEQGLDASRRRRAMLSLSSARVCPVGGSLDELFAEDAFFVER